MTEPPSPTPPSDESPTVVAVLERALDHLIARDERQARWLGIKRTAIACVVLFGVGMSVVLYGPLVGWRTSPSSPSVAVVPIIGSIGGNNPAGANLIVPDRKSVV